MKKIFYRIQIATFILLFASLESFAQSSEIELPDVTTVISGNDVSIEKDALPDFSKILPSETPINDLEVQLPSSSIEQDQNIGSEKIEEIKVKDVFAEGQVGGGFPGQFTGDFSVYRSSGENPFLLRFNHESSAGYSKKTASNGFFDNKTEISGIKTFTLPSEVWNFSGSYYRSDDGMQNVSETFFNTTKQNLSGNADLMYKPADIFSLFVKINPAWYSRYTGDKSSSVSSEKYEERASIFTLQPELKANWALGSFNLSVDANYQQQNNLAGDKYISGLGNNDKQATYRGDFGAEIEWSNDFLKVFENASAIVGTSLGENNSVIIPFTVGLSIFGQPDFMSGVCSFSVKGGLDSKQITYSALEEKFKFSALNFIPSETTDWYGEVKFTLPVHQLVTLSGSAEYRKTAFKNGVWEADYSSISSAGIYSFVQSEKETFRSEASLAFHAGLFTAGATWTANWLDIPVLESEHNISLSAELQSRNSRVGANASVGFEAGENSDKTPVLDAGTFVRATSSLRIALEADDIVKLVTGEVRTYEGKYCARSGNATLLLKFFF